jgi:F-type H+-transporting ATPase subunit gamma
LNVIRSLEDVSSNPFANEREIRHVLLIPVTSDKGLCGAFNSNVIKRTLALIEGEFNSLEKNGNLNLMPIGIKGYDYFNKRGYNVIGDYNKLFSHLTFDHVKKAADDVIAGFLDHDYDKIVLVYNEFKNVATQIMRVEQFLPLSDQSVEDEANMATDYIFEPSKVEIKNELIPQSLRIQFYKAILANASEHGARMTAMETATENADELLGELHIIYNRTRQAAITKEILDIVGGAEALASQ